MIARHAKNPPCEVMQRYYRNDKRVYEDSFEIKLIEIIKKETGINILKEAKYRGRKTVEARAIFAVMLANHTLKSYVEIGKLIGKDHSTISHSNKMVDNLCHTDKRFNAIFKNIDLQVRKLKIN
jgi:chromosomal replication initiation ATPase DnaA